ncbi:MAG: flippase-like domain-containing protein [Pseudolabrys sp.]|nr:flippase-like domain-containing protein [Pseudolabrys sp.]
MRQKIALAVKIIISVTLLYIALRKVDIASVETRLHDVGFVWLAAAIAVSAGQVFLSAGRWWVISRLCGIVIAYSRAFRYTMIGIFFNQTLPSSVGGDAVRIWLLVRNGASWSSSTYSVLLDRIVGVLALSIIVVGSLAWALVLIANPTARLTLIVIGFGTIAGFIVFVLLRHVRHTSLMRWNAVRHLVQISTIAGDTLFSLKTGPFVIVCSLCIHFLTVLTAWCLGKAAHAPFDLLQALVVIPPVILISTIPISIAGWGVRETALALAFSYIGLSQTDGVIVSLLLGATMVAVGIAGGIVWLATDHTAPQSNPVQSG